ncbi:hypothetical protein [Streptomyces sp. TRM49041]|uniref:hypothetical protein n=1 Tax=Streptomyces sp. TRM49041 TaxID=2603216 RepID=UPI0021CC627F|nr:hypothetical protein [Streptomyces sp. TRM49041]
MAATRDTPVVALTGAGERSRFVEGVRLDASSRITAVQAPDWTEQYAYNLAGDQTHTTLPSEAPGRHTPANAPTTAPASPALDAPPTATTPRAASHSAAQPPSPAKP